MNCLGRISKACYFPSAHLQLRKQTQVAREFSLKKGLSPYPPWETNSVLSRLILQSMAVLWITRIIFFNVSHFLLFNHAFYSVYRISITSFLQFLTNHFTYPNFLFYDKNPLDNSTHLSCKILIYKLENQAVFFLLGVFLISSQILVLLFYSWLFQA